MSDPLRDPIRLQCTFDSLHADGEGEITLKLKLPASECATAGLFPVLRDIIFDATFTPNDVQQRERERF